ncbi:MAG: hypothetical protein RL148_2419 [Planctomycetota bacterium]
MADGPQVAALLLNFRKPALTEQALADLLAVTGVAVRTLVIDNGSGDGSAARLAGVVAAHRANGHDVELLELPENLGFAGAMNEGVAWARQQDLQLVLLLNNDLRLPPDFLAPMVRVLANDPRVTAVGPTIVRPDGRVWAQGGRLGFHPNALTLRAQGRLPAPRTSGPEAVDFLPGACVLARRADLEAVGGLDDGYFMYWEDVELCRRLRVRGQVVWLPWAQVVHEAGSSSGGARSPLRKFLMAANEVRYVRRNGTAAQWLGMLLWDVLLWPLSLAGGPACAVAKLRGLVRGLSSRPIRAAEVVRYLPQHH